MKSETNYSAVVWVDGRTTPLINTAGEDYLWVKSQLDQTASIVTRCRDRPVRVSKATQGHYVAVAMGWDEARIKSKKLLNRDIEALLAAAPIVEAAVTAAEQRSSRLIHNLKTITAKTLQEVFFVAQQDRMLASTKDVAAYVADEIRENPDDAARAFVEILKHQSAQKAEYAAFEKLSGALNASKQEVHEVHRVLMNVFYLFFGAFVSRKIRAKVEETHLKAIFDYDSIHACIYYIVDNAAKYSRSNSSLNVTVSRDADGLVDIRFDMESLVVEAGEAEKVFLEGYSGVRARAESLAGQGLGLHLARQLSQMNGGRLNLIAGKSKASGYARNTFTLTLPAG